MDVIVVSVKTTMTVTLTIKQVPEPLALKLRERALASHRSLQGELLAILHDAASAPPRATEPSGAPYSVKRRINAKKLPPEGRRLDLAELWERSRRLGGKSRSESAAIVRKLRDERHGR